MLKVYQFFMVRKICPRALLSSGLLLEGMSSRQCLMLISPLRLLDLSELAEIKIRGSIFDETFAGLEDKAMFFKRLVNELSRPVMPNDEKEQYVVTQVMAEYLSNRIDPRFDGILYPSAQTGETVKNVVLFHHASMIEPYEKDSGTHMDISWAGLSSLGDEDTTRTIADEISVKVTERLSMQDTSDEFNMKAAPTSALNRPTYEQTVSEYAEAYRFPPTLRLNLDTLTAIQIIKMVPEIVKFSTSYDKL